MTLIAFVVLVVVAAIVGIVAQMLERKPFGYETLMVAVAALFGFYFFSEAIPASSTFAGLKDWGPVFDGFVLIPGILGGLVVALIVDLGMRSATSTA